MHRKVDIRVFRVLCLLSSVRIFCDSCTLHYRESELALREKGKPERGSNHKLRGSISF